MTTAQPVTGSALSAEPPSSRPSNRLLRWVGIAAALLVGALVGLVGAFVQAQRLVADTVTVPWGLALVWLVLIVTIRGAAWAVGTRWGSWAVAVGWLVVTVAMTAESPSGDVAISGGTRQLVYLLVGVVLASAAATLPLPRPSRRSRR